MRFALILAVFASSAFAASPGPAPAPKATVTFTQAGVSRTLNATAPTACLGIYGSVIRASVGPCGGGSYVQFPKTGGDVSVHWSAQDACGPQPAPASRHADCPAGTTGSGWLQSAAYTSAPAPSCWVLGQYQPAEPPAGTCVAEPPPVGGALNIDFSFVDRASPEYADFISFANRTDEAEPQTLAYAYRITGQQSYCDRAVPQVAAWMQHPEDFADDSYLQIDQYLAPAMMVREWCPSVTSAQRADWLAKAKAAVDAVWAQGCPGWGVCDLQNNYHAHFVRATVYVAISSGEPSRITFALGKLNEQLAALNATQPNGGSLEGKGYQYAWKWLNDSALVVRDSGYGDVFNSNGYLSANALEWVHATTPDMAHFAPIGSQPRDSAASIYDYQAGSVKEGCYQTTNAVVRNAAGYWVSHIGLDWYRANGWDNLWKCPAVSTPPALVYNARGVAIYARTSWSSSANYLAAVIYDRSQSHAHSEFGEILYWLNGGWGVTSGQSLSHSGINGEPPDWSTRAKSVVGIFAGGGAAKDAACAQARAPANTVRPKLSSAKALADAAAANVIAARARAAMLKACNTPNAEVAIRPVEGFPIVTDYTENQATGDVSFCVDSTANYPGSVSLLKRCVAFVGGVVTVTDSVRLTGASSAKQQWIVPGTSAACTSTQCTAGSLKITPADAVPMNAALVPLSSFDSDFDRGGQRVSRECSTGCSTKLSP